MLAQALLTGALAGFASTLHCTAMCGPLAAVSCGSSLHARARYQLGRMLGYGFAGGLAGGLGGSVRGLLGGQIAAFVLPALVALCLALLARKLWPSTLAPSALVQLAPSDPRARRSRRLVQLVMQLVPAEPLLRGGLTALLPCGALLAALGLAAASHDRASGAALMLAFAGTSALGVLGGATLLDKLTKVHSRTPARVLAITLGALAVLIGARPIYELTTHGDRPLRTAAASCH